MKSKAIILFLIAVFILVFINACSAANTAETVTTTVQTVVEKSPEEIYFKEITRISNALTNSTGIYYQACDDFLNFDIDLSGHKKATEDFVGGVLVLSTAYKKLEPPENYKTVHNLFGTSLEHFGKGAGYLTQYIKAYGDDMNVYLEKAIPEIELAAKYLNEANKEIKNVNQY